MEGQLKLHDGAGGAQNPAPRLNPPRRESPAAGRAGSDPLVVQTQLPHEVFAMRVDGLAADAEWGGDLGGPRAFGGQRTASTPSAGFASFRSGSRPQGCEDAGAGTAVHGPFDVE